MNTENTLKYKLLYVFTYAPIGVIAPLIGQYLKSIGFTGSQIGIVTGLGTLAAIGASAFWGKIYANSRDGKILIAGLCIFSAISSVINLNLKEFLGFALGYMLMYFFQGSIQGLTDARVLEEKENFSNIRLFGAIGYSLAVFIGGRVGESFGLDKIFIIYVGLFLIGALICIALKSPRDSKLKNLHDLDPNISEKYGYGIVAANREVCLLILSGVFISGSNMANNTFFGFLYREGGGTVAGIGTVFLIMVGSEAPFMWLSGILARKFPINRLILIAMFVSFARFTFYGFGPNYILLILTCVSQGFVNGILLVQYLRYLSEKVKPEHIAITIACYYAVGTMGGAILCNITGGFVMDILGSDGVYGFFAILNALGIIIYLYSEKKFGRMFRNKL